MSSAYLRLLIFLMTILIPACASSNLTFHMMYSAYKLNKQGDNIQAWCTSFPIWNQSVVPCLWRREWQTTSVFLPWEPHEQYEKKCSLLGKCRSKLQSDITSYQSEWPSSKSLQTINAGEGVEKKECSYTVDGNVNWYSHYGRWYGGSLKSRNKK